MKTYTWLVAFGFLGFLGYPAARGLITILNQSGL